jgi:hypothetical protein
MRGRLALQGFRLIAAFGRSLYRGDVWSWSVLLGALVVGILCWLVWFAKRPLGGDPEKNPADEDQFGDSKNPYRDLT